MTAHAWESEAIVSGQLVVVSYRASVGPGRRAAAASTAANALHLKVTVPSCRSAGRPAKAEQASSCLTTPSFSEAPSVQMPGAH